MIRILQIETDTEEKAETLWKKVNEPKADFASIAEKESGGSQVEFQLEWSDTLKCFGGDGFFSGTGSDQRNYFLGREILYSKMHIGL